MHHKVPHTDGRRSVDAQCTVHKDDTALAASLVEVGERLGEVATDVVAVSVLGLYHQQHDGSVECLKLRFLIRVNRLEYIFKKIDTDERL